MRNHEALTFDEWLRDELDRRHMRQGDLAELIGVDQSTVSGWATGASRPTPGNCDRIARIFLLARNEVRRRAGRPVVRGELSSVPDPRREPSRDPSDPLFQRFAGIGLTLSDDEIVELLERFDRRESE